MTETPEELRDRRQDAMVRGHSFAHDTRVPGRRKPAHVQPNLGEMICAFTGPIPGISSSRSIAPNPVPASVERLVPLEYRHCRVSRSPSQPTVDPRDVTLQNTF